ncbi:MAG: hypothetical protein C0599_17440 [Salinivirgaceae bacterium]|nr:MAG: hypothetical protein C0599_17440 [Salinivirgaceae bacterium]
MTHEELIQKWLSGELSEQERKDFESSEEFAKIEKLLNAAKAFKAPVYDVNKEYNRLSNNLSTRKSVSLFQRFNPIMRVAAVLIPILFLATLIYYFIGTSTEQNNWIADQDQIFLPDSSYVRLNKDSKIRYANTNWRNERSVELIGEAFFSVEKGSQFNVATTEGVVAVLGTEFNVKNRDGFYEVVCYSGSVKVTTDYTSVVLESSKGFRVIDGKEENFNISDRLEPDWLNGESSFNSVPLRVVIEELERQYGVSVVTNNIDLNQLYTGGFDHNDLNVALESIAIPLKLDYKINGNEIILTFEGK